MAKYVVAKFDVSHLSPQEDRHLIYVIEQYLKQKGVEYDEELQVIDYIY